MITIQKCEFEHFPLLFDVALQSYKDAYKYLWNDKGDAYIKKSYSRSLWEIEFARGTADYFLVYHHQEIAGYCKLKNNQLLSYPQKNCLEVEKLYLLKNFIGKGIGKTILHFIEDLAKSQQKALIWLNVMQNSPANSFYKLNGFEQILESYLDYPHMKEEFRIIATLVKQVLPTK